jgi:hypothetical protein
MKEVREYFRENYGHVDFWDIKDEVISEFLKREYLERLTFELKMDCLYDYLMANQLVDYTE